jgi:hypothetical protein
LQRPIIERLTDSKASLIDQPIENWLENWDKPLLFSMNENTQKTSEFESITCGNSSAKAFVNQKPVCIKPDCKRDRFSFTWIKCLAEYL